MSPNQQDIHRLGKRELGRHATEESMPQKIAGVLNQENVKNRVNAVIPKLAKLLEQDHDLAVAYLCTSSVAQVSKRQNEGAHFCGYRNIQMLLSAISDSSTNHAALSEKGPGVLELQDMIEQAWDMGFNSHGRTATGGVRGTRKHIGSSEAEALLLSIDVPCTGRVFGGKDAWLQLLDSVEQHFSQADPGSSSNTVIQTTVSPVFLQRPNHSLTVVGIERGKNGNRRLLCFDPAWQPPVLMQQPGLPTTLSNLSRCWTLKMYRKNERYLKRYHAFETLVIEGMP